MANVLFKRIEDSALIDNYPIVDGSMYTTKDGKMFVDYDDVRVPVGGTPDSTMSDRSTNAVQNKVVTKYINDSIGDVNQVVVTTLWENQNPRTSYDANIISLSSDDYDYLEIFYLTHYSTMYDFSGIQSTKILPGYNGELLTVFYDNTSSSMFYANRSMMRTSDTSFSFTNCYATSAGTSGIPQIMNGFCIPVKIVGYKYGKGLS